MPQPSPPSRLLAALAALAAASARVADPPFDASKVLFSGAFTSGVVLQRAPALAAVFGTAAAGAAVTVTLTGPAGYSFTSAPVPVAISPDPALNGTWRVLLPARPPGLGYALEARCQGCANATTDAVADVGFGDVYLCSGQSNMECPVLTTVTRNDSYAQASAGLYDHIRIFQVGWRLSGSNTSSWILPRDPEPDSGGYPQRTWQLPRGPGASLERFSALCWYFGKAMSDLSGDGAKVPIGLIASSIGGTTIQEWMPPSTTGNSTCADNNCGWVEQLDPERPVQPGTQPDCTNASQANVWSCPSGLCSSLWHSMIAPFVNMTIAAIAWYQGEQNIIYGVGSAISGYQCQQAAMIAAWRRAFSATPGTTAPDVAFGVTTLAGGCSEGFPLFSPFQHADEAAYLACATGDRRLPACEDLDNDYSGGLRVAQTGGFGHTPNAALPNVFLGQAFDQGEPCMCDREALAPHGCWANSECYGDGLYSLNVTWNYQLAEIHPRVKHIIGERLARSLLALRQGRVQATPKLAGCRLQMEAQRLVLIFDASLLGGEAVSLQAPGPGLVPLEFRVGQPTHNSTGWVFAQALVSVNSTSIAAVLPTGVGAPDAVRYAWGSYPCCPELNASTFFCPPTACPILTSVTAEPAVPFWASIDAVGHCSCAPPWACDA